MKLSEIKNGNLSAEWAEKGYKLPKFRYRGRQGQDPRRTHLGALRRRQYLPCIPGCILNDALNTGKYEPRCIAGREL